jgi:hypothetical protein
MEVSNGRSYYKTGISRDPSYCQIPHATLKTSISHDNSDIQESVRVSVWTALLLDLRQIEEVPNGCAAPEPGDVKHHF